MTKEKDIRETQTKSKHVILEQYLKAWYGIIFWGLKNKEMRSVPRFVYVDGFAWKGKYEDGDLDDPKGIPVYGSPIIGIRAMDALAKYAIEHNRQIFTNTILVEKNKKRFNSLLETLSDLGYENRIRETTAFYELREGEIAVVNADVTTLEQQLIGFTDRLDTWAFYLLDPFGGSGIPYDFVKTIVQGKNHDVMINFIYEDFLRKTGMVFSKTQLPQHRHLVEIWKEVFTDDIWKNRILALLEQIDAHKKINAALGMSISFKNADGDSLTNEELKALKEEIFVSGYVDTLKNMDRDMVIKFIALRYPNRERTMLYLFLTTHDPTGALTLNKVLNEAHLLEYELRLKVNMANRIRAGQLSFLPDLNVDVEKDKQSLSRPDKDEIAKCILEKFKDCTATKKQVYQALVETDYFPNEIDKALRHLRKKGFARFQGKFTHYTEIEFS